MNARLIKLWQDLQSSYYFIPALMGLGAIILAFITSQIDRNLGADYENYLGWFYSNSAEGARAILSTIAGSMITVAGVTFSMTMVAVTSASAQFGPRLIGNFMRDKANQFTLGTFTSTFVYCLLIMRVTRTGDPANADDQVVAIIPNISLLVALGMTLISVGVLIYFVHHIPETLNVGKITARLGRELRKTIEDLSDDGDISDQNDVDMSQFLRENALDVKSENEGYVQAFNTDALLKLAKDHSLVIRIQFRPGDFCVKGNVIAHVWGSHDEASEKITRKIKTAFALGGERTVHQNVLFLADELVEILARALSPGVNDPFTAINCMNWFHSALNYLAHSTPASPYKFDDEGELRLIIFPISFERFLSVICDQSRPYVASDRNAAFHMVSILTELAAGCEDDARKQKIVEKLDDLYQAAQQQLTSKPDLDDLESRYSKSLEIINDPDLYDAELGRQGWLGGRA